MQLGIEKVWERCNEWATRHALLDARKVAESPIDAASLQPVVRMFRRIGLLNHRPKSKSQRDFVREMVGEFAARRGMSFRAALFPLRAYAEGVEEEAEPMCGARPRCDACELVACCDYGASPPRVTDMPEEDRPRERLMAHGVDALSNEELIAIILGSGTRGENALQIGRRILSQMRGLRPLGLVSIQELMAIPGIGPARAITLKAAFELGRRAHTELVKKDPALSSPQKVYEYFIAFMREENQETFWVAWLDVKNRPLQAPRCISRGSLTSTIVQPREAFIDAIRASAAAVVFAHNHPSGDPEPSREDWNITARLRQAGEILGIRVLDHVIVGANDFVSLAERGWRP